MVIELSGVPFGLKSSVRVISKSNERVVRVRFEITSMTNIARQEVQQPLY